MSLVGALVKPRLVTGTDRGTTEARGVAKVGLVESLWVTRGKNMLAKCDNYDHGHTNQPGLPG